MEKSNFYREFYKLEDDTEESLMHLFVQRLAGETFDSRSKKADRDISLLYKGNPDSPKTGSSYEKRQNLKEKEPFAWRVSSGLNEKEFASNELIKIKSDLDSGGINDKYIRESVRCYIELLNKIIAGLPGFTFDDELKEPANKSRAFNYLSENKIISGNETDFIMAFTKGGKLNEPLKWLLLNRFNKPNQDAFFAFLRIMFGTVKRSHKRDANRIFINMKGNPLVINEGSGPNESTVLIDFKFEENLKQIISSE